jgi:hypothetical protein
MSRLPSLVTAAPLSGGLRRRRRLQRPVPQAVPHRFGEPEVDQWVLSEVVLRRIVPTVGVHPFPLNELLLMVSAVSWFRPSHIFEWGTHIGKSARVFYEATRTLDIPAVIHSVDLPDHHEHAEHPHHKRGQMVRGLTAVHLHQGDGLDVSLALYRCERPRPALFFVDGDHGYESVHRELTGILDAAPEAAVLLHDTFWQRPQSGYNVGPNRAIGDVLASRIGYRTFSPDLGLPGMTLVYRPNGVDTAEPTTRTV